MKKLAYKEVAKRNAEVSNNCHHCGCSIAFEPMSSLFYAEHDGQVFTFCSSKCRSFSIKNSTKMDL